MVESHGGCCVGNTYTKEDGSELVSKDAYDIACILSAWGEFLPFWLSFLLSICDYLLTFIASGCGLAGTRFRCTYKSCKCASRLVLFIWTIVAVNILAATVYIVLQGDYDREGKMIDSAKTFALAQTLSWGWFFPIQGSLFVLGYRCSYRRFREKFPGLITILDDKVIMEKGDVV